MDPAINQVVFHAEVVARCQRLVAGGAREAAEVVHRVPRAHHHLRGRDSEVAAGTSLHGKPSGANKNTLGVSTKTLGLHKTTTRPTFLCYAHCLNASGRWELDVR